MKNLSDNSLTDMIYVFLDGEANATEQQVLFQHLANNADLRQEFDKAVHIYTGFKNDKNRTYPPVALTNSVFASAGFSVPYSLPVSTSSTAAGSTFSNLLRKVFFPVLMAFLGAVITFLLFKFPDNSTQSTKINDFAFIQAGAGNNNFISSDGSALFHYNSNPVTSNYSGNKTVYLPIKDINSNQQEIIPQQDRNFNLNETNLIANSNNNLNQSNTYNFNTLSFPVFATEDIKPEKLNSRFQLELKGASALNYFPVREGNQPQAGNLGIGLLYKLDANNLLGVHAAKEPLYLYRVNDNNYLSEFTPVQGILWFGTNYRYLFDGLFNLPGFRPFVDVTLAASEFGPLTKGMAGIQYNTGGLLNFSAGVEGAMLFYKFRNNIQTTEKIAFFYNIGINF